ncbi:MAG: hypothetical protein LQ342_006076 [Letrouitia transgressa]|nr:MAG: hypothetical protein LQ342_006076 [Letrouitia transgressa]
MDKVKDFGKHGWHPKGKDGGKESWRGDFKGINQMAGWVGKGKDPHTQAQEHQSRPLASLKDPVAFGPPPKNVNYHGGAAVPNATTPDRRGLGAPLKEVEIPENGQEQRIAEEAARKPAPPPVPYRANTTGLSTNNLPKPPMRRVEREQSGQLPVRSDGKPKPLVPPRLPPRQDSASVQEPSSPPPPYSITTQSPAPSDVHINQGAVNRLGKAGVSVPGLGIGNDSASPVPASQSNVSSPSHNHGSQVNEMRSRIANLSTKPSSPDSTQGTSLAQKQAAVQTAQSFHKDPSSVSMADAKATAATMNNFRERHGDQVEAGWRNANSFNKKYGIADKVNSYASQSSNSGEARSPQSPNATDLPSAIHKRAPPPPPGKPNATIQPSASPPPVPLSSKPRG